MKELNSIELQNINGGLSEVSTSILEGMATCKRLRDATIVLQTRVFSFVIKKR